MAAHLRYKQIGLADFLARYPGMRIVPMAGLDLLLQGEFRFAARTDPYGEVRDSFRLRIQVPPAFPKELPSVYETARRIPWEEAYHVNITTDCSLCLGSRLRLLVRLADQPHLCGFAMECLEPYLYAVSYKLTHGGSLVLGELAHGAEGELSDYKELFGVDTDQQASDAYQCLCMKPRVAYKRPCPCGCGRRLGRCPYRNTLDALRSLAPRRWFRTNQP